MKYSLRSLMIAVTLICVLLGGVMGRVEYLRRMAAFHREELERLSLRGDGLETEEFWAMVRHERLCSAYEDAVFRPWTIVREPKITREGHVRGWPAPKPPKE